MLFVRNQSLSLFSLQLPDMLDTVFVPTPQTTLHGVDMPFVRSQFAIPDELHKLKSKSFVEDNRNVTLHVFNVRWVEVLNDENRLLKGTARTRRMTTAAITTTVTTTMAATTRPLFAPLRTP